MHLLQRRLVELDLQLSEANRGQNSFGEYLDRARSVLSEISETNQAVAKLRGFVLDFIHETFQVNPRLWEQHESALAIALASIIEVPMRNLFSEEGFSLVALRTQLLLFGQGAPPEFTSALRSLDTSLNKAICYEKEQVAKRGGEVA